MQLSVKYDLQEYARSLCQPAYISNGPDNYLSEIVNFREHYRIKRQPKRDVRNWEKDEKKRKTEVDDRNKKKMGEMFKSLLGHREEFFRFHKAKRSGMIVKLITSNTY